METKTKKDLARMLDRIAAINVGVVGYKTAHTDDGRTTVTLALAREDSSAAKSDGDYESEVISCSACGGFGCLVCGGHGWDVQRRLRKRTEILGGKGLLPRADKEESDG
jgi:hypothetical protein